MRIVVDPSGIPLTPQEVIWARCRHAAARTPLPEVGAQVWYRHDLHGMLTPATILEVKVKDFSDPNVWTVDLDENDQPLVNALGQPNIRMVPDPWPEVLLDTATFGRVVTREARIANTPGWLPMSGA